MKNRNFKILFALIALNTYIIGCPYCNSKFYEELFTIRGGSLLSEELINSINNQAGRNNIQQSIGLSISSVVPAEKQRNSKEFIEIIERDNKLPIPQTSYVSQDRIPDKKVEIELSEGEVYIGNGVLYKGFTTNNNIPGPTIILDEGDIVEFTVINKGAIPHGASIHAAYTQTSKYLGKIEPGKSKTILFRVTYPGVYMYHCAPGGHAIPMHVIFGQYGMMVVKPKKKYKLETILNRPPDVEIYLNQHEFYSSGKDAIDGKPLYTVFNGKIFRYVEEPIKAKPGDYVRIYFLNIGPNLLSTFHLVGIIWDYAYWQGHPDNIFTGGQSVTAGPTDSWVVEFRVPPDEGGFLMLSHAVGSTDRGAIGLLVCDDSANTPVVVPGDGPVRTKDELASLKSKITRIISPFEPGSRDVDPVEVYGPETEEVLVKIIGNSYYPKSIQIAKGTKVRWVNEDVFTYMEGEFAGIHNVVSYEGGPQAFSSNLLAHGESFEFIFEDEGEYKYMCTPHPYMKGSVKVMGASRPSTFGTSALGVGFLSAILVFVVLILGILVYDRRNQR